ncbi:MAG: hypothetical protein ABS54_08605 [Hyphomicrobium sp. SCN 65-11]|nr:MAG: hypothetical protein ABS54_08605 [Hyphomicrobium sp. SCN 65-11]
MLHRPGPYSEAGTSPRVLDVTHVVAGLSRDAGGPSYSVPALAAALAQRGAAVRVRTVETDDARRDVGDDVALCAHPTAGGPLGRLLRASPSLKAALAADARDNSILHTHGLWLMPNIYPARLKRRSDRPLKLVHSPRGMLAPAALGISAWKKRPFWWLLQKSALEAADCIHATAASEYEEIRAAGLGNPVAIIPNGINLPLLAETSRGQSDGNVVLSFGRIHPKKGLDRLLRAWARVEHEFPTWRLRIVGPAEVRHDEELRALAQALGVKKVSIEGPIYDADEKLAMYRDAGLFVLPTLNENFALTVAEALGAEVPVISTKGAPWSGLEKERCGWWIDHGEEPLAAALRNAMTIGQAERRAMGKRGRAWMARDFGWDRIASDMLEVYRWLKDGGSPPPTVRLG